MKNQTEIQFLLCVPVSDRSRPWLPSRKERCASCGVWVWVAEGVSRAQIERGVKPLCIPCISATGKKKVHVTVTPEQVMEGLNGLTDSN